MTTDKKTWWIVDVDADDASIREAVDVIPKRLEGAGFAHDDRRPLEAWQAARDHQPHNAALARIWQAIQSEVLARAAPHCPTLNSPYATEAEVVPLDVAPPLKSMTTAQGSAEGGRDQSGVARKPPLLVVLAGIPGSGKTTLAHGITAVRGFEIVSRDKIRLVIDPGWDQPDAKDSAFEMACMKIGRCLQEGRRVIAEGMPFSRRSERLRLQAIAELHEARLLLLWVDADVKTAALRIEGDADHPAKDRAQEAAHAVSARFESFDDDERAVRIDGTKDQRFVLSAALEAIDKVDAADQ